jgi:Zn-dependent M28 family amino/carboxypeptidase
MLAIAWVVAIILAAAALAGRATDNGFTYVVVAAVVGALPVIASVVGPRSPGAVDNASGVATVLLAASLLPARAPVGVLITDAEELGLAGARAWCASTRRPRAPVLNCDGVDDAGPLTLMWTRPRARRLEEALQVAATALDERLRVIPLVPGVLVDGAAFADAGWEAVTVSRGTVGTLRRIHTRADNLDQMNGAGIAHAARVLARAATTLTE